MHLLAEIWVYGLIKLIKYFKAWTVSVKSNRCFCARSIRLRDEESKRLHRRSSPRPSRDRKQPSSPRRLSPTNTRSSRSRGPEHWRHRTTDLGNHDNNETKIVTSSTNWRQSHKHSTAAIPRWPLCAHWSRVHRMDNYESILWSICLLSAECSLKHTPVCRRFKIIMARLHRHRFEGNRFKNSRL